MPLTRCRSFEFFRRRIQLTASVSTRLHSNGLWMHDAMSFPILRSAAALCSRMYKCPPELQRLTSQPAQPSACTSCATSTTSARKSATCTFPTRDWQRRIQVSIRFSSVLASACSVKKSSECLAAASLGDVSSQVRLDLDTRRRTATASLEACQIPY